MGILVLTVDKVLETRHRQLVVTRNRAVFYAVTLHTLLCATCCSHRLTGPLSIGPDEISYDFNESIQLQRVCNFGGVRSRPGFCLSLISAVYQLLLRVSGWITSGRDIFILRDKWFN